MKIAIIGLGHAFEKQYSALKTIREFKKIELCDNDKEKIKKYNCTENYLKLDSDCAIIATSPKLHLEMLLKLNEQSKKILIEKPIVTSLSEIKRLEQIINYENYYNSLHFAFGLEIDYFIKKIGKKPNKIYCYISDNYVLNNKIKKEAISLCGSYLDEVINPLSAVARMFGYDIKYVSSQKKTYPNDTYDYYSLSNFKVENIPVVIEVMWNNQLSQKYIDLYYDDYTLRLDSMNQKVINLTSNQVLFEAKGDRMTNHYIGVYKDYLQNGSNYDISIKLHKELLKGVENEN